MSEKIFDIVVIGSGPAGTSAAESAHDAGARSIAVIESAERLGGECPNWGCVPTKALLKSAEVFLAVKNAGAFGVNVENVSLDFKKVMDRKTAIVNSMTGQGRMEGVYKELGIELIRGKAKFVGKNEIEVDGQRIQGKKFVIATGSKAFIPPMDGIDTVKYWTSDDLVSMTSLPESVVIVGGGPIGVESAQILSTFGTKVTIVEFSPHILSREDSQIAEYVSASFENRGVTVISSAKATKVEKTEKGIKLLVESLDDGKKEVLEAEVLMMATGKRANIETLHLDNAYAELTERGAPSVNRFMQSTSNPDIYFAGDAAGHMMFTHVAHEHGVIAGENAISGNSQKVNMRVVPRGTFCTPEVGSVGVTEKEAREKGVDVAVGVWPYSGLGKSVVTDELEGLIKIVADKNTGLVIGGHVVGFVAAELVHEIALAMYADVPYAKIAEMIHAYPTFAEGIGVAAYSIQ